MSAFVDGYRAMRSGLQPTAAPGPWVAPCYRPKIPVNLMKFAGKAIKSGINRPVRVARSTGFMH